MDGDFHLSEPVSNSTRIAESSFLLQPTDRGLRAFLKKSLDALMGMPDLRERVNAFRQVRNLTPEAGFWETAARVLGLEIEIETNGLENISSLAGRPFLLLANHPHGLLDGITLGVLFEKHLKRRDYTFIANEIIGAVFAEAKPFLLPVNNMS
jgi:hypothetical protein